jgi:hypothetical protein
MLLAQQQASDQWAFYQAKVIREHFYRGPKMRRELDLLEKESLKPSVRQKMASIAILTPQNHRKKPSAI